MIALRLRFPAGRYHATPWGRHVNEAAIAWPPEPVRILRALIACHHRKADKTQFSDDALADLIDALAVWSPIYKLPEAIRAHTRHYMPLQPNTEPKLLFDAFTRFDPEHPLIVGWPSAALRSEQRMHLDHLAARLSYLGRAESWVDAEVFDWNGDDANAKPHDCDGEGKERSPGTLDLRLAPLYAPLSPDDYRRRREQLIDDERARRRAGWTKKGKPTVKALEKDMRHFLATLPERLASAIAVETSELHAVRWSEPPACQRVLYAAPELASVWRGSRRGTTRTRPDPTVARFVLAGRPRPRIEDAVKIGELMRLATLAQFGWTKDEATGRLRANAPSVISGRGSDNRPLRDADHRHAFWLPEDADGDGEIDHVVVCARVGFDQKVRGKLDRLTRLWIGRAGNFGEEVDADVPRPRQEWRLALEGFGMPHDFRDASRLLGKSHTWQSVTPFLAAGHLKAGGYPAEIQRLLKCRKLREPIEIDFVRSASSNTPIENGLSDKDIGICINGRLRRAIDFHRFRSRGGERQPDPIGTFLRVRFADLVEGPLALGYGCHFGLGLFAAVSEDGWE
ncbi:MAG: type I-U CRISPR-associated protein Csb2 [Methylacidiphilaceae bacterium]|nr:type I-U CRISPR-associated protein Csb2 [Candidatus Methylacidiphilaceae bacterium]